MVIVALLALVITGCTSAPGSRPPEETSLTSFDQFTLMGKAAISGPSGGHNIRLLWQQDGGSYRAELGGPLGLGKARLAGDENGLTHLEHRDQRLTGTEARRWLQYELGFGLPLSALTHWLKGQPTPHAPYENISDGSGTGRIFEQAGWTLIYDDYRPLPGSGGSLSLPYSITVTTGQYRARLKISSWKSDA